jgi:formylglycine-generating enzyme required for sulfatase activity
MSRTGYNYGKVGGRRAGSTTWQWIVIGVILASFCWAIIVLALLTAGVLNLDTEAVGIAGNPTDTPTTAPPVAQVEVATSTPWIITATPNPTTAVEVPIEAPTATDIPPTVDPNTVPVEESPTPTLTLMPTISSIVDTNNGDPVPDALKGLISSLVSVDGGSFQMGTTPAEVAEAVRQCIERDGGNCLVKDGEDSYPVHQVTIDPFQIEMTEVTFEQYVAFLNWKFQSSNGTWRHTNGCDGQICLATRSDTGGENSYITFDSANYDVLPSLSQFPMVNVTWYGAKAYCEAIGRRLPTEAEWEHAARGPNDFLYPWGNEWDPTYAKTNRPTTDAIGAIEVGSTRTAGGVSAYGAYDMAGNVAEWVSDWYLANFYSQPEATLLNPSGPRTGQQKVIRGGSWDTVPFFARSVHRQSAPPNDQKLWLGFRCAADIDSPVSVLPSPNPATLGTLDNAAPTMPAPPTTDVNGLATEMATLEP